MQSQQLAHFPKVLAAGRGPAQVDDDQQSRQSWTILRVPSGKPKTGIIAYREGGRGGGEGHRAREAHFDLSLLLIFAFGQEQPNDNLAKGAEVVKNSNNNNSNSIYSKNNNNNIAAAAAAALWTAKQLALSINGQESWLTWEIVQRASNSGWLKNRYAT